MRKAIIIYQEDCLTWGLNLSEAAVLDYLLNACFWADPIHLEGKVFYFVARQKAAVDLPLLSNSVRKKLEAGEEVTWEDADTFYRHYKSLEKKDLITLAKFNGKDCFAPTEKVKGWGASDTSKAKFLGTSDNSDNFPTNNPLLQYKERVLYAGEFTGDSEKYPTPDRNANDFNRKDFKGLPPQERRIRLALEAAKDYFTKQFPAMKTTILERASLQMTDAEFWEMLEQWVRNNGNQPYFLANITNNIPSNFQNWAIREKNYRAQKRKGFVAAPEQTTVYDTSVKEIKSGASKEVASLITKKRVQ